MTGSHGAAKNLPTTTSAGREKHHLGKLFSIIISMLLKSFSRSFLLASSLSVFPSMPKPRLERDTCRELEEPSWAEIEVVEGLVE